MLKTKQPLNYGNIAFLTLTPLVALLGTSWYVCHHGITKLELANFFVMYLLTGVAVTGGYHRYYAHKSYECSRLLQLFYLVFGAAAAENSVLNWASDHRIHHRFVDKKEDPYNILRGGFYAHMGWIFYKDTRRLHDKYRNVPDLLKDPLVLWQDRWYLFLVVAATFALPTYIGLVQGRPVGGLLWGGFLRVVVVHHMTFFINSLAHLCGSRPYAVTNSARDNWWLGPLTFGEGYHNFHHKFQADYRNGIRWYQFDLTKWWLHAMRVLGQVRRLKRTPESLILKARLEVQVRHVEARLAAVGASGKMWGRIQPRLRSGRERLELAMARYHQAKLDYRRQKHQWSEDMRRQWEANLGYCRAELQEARRRWAGMIRAMNRISHPSAELF
ncbi:MAG: fatty acid desaturase [Elusimicrobia bacterium]|nr:fatty acid desaturase [Elusimicrobiota bacterium]